MRGRRPSDSERRDWLRGVTVLVGGGVEGWTGSLASRIRPGPAWDVLVGFRPTTVFGVELAYSGSVNEVKYVNLGLPTPSDGADMVRNGGHADVTFGLASTLVQPFVLAGVGITHYDVRTASAQAAGFQSDTAGYIPLGGGIRAQMGVFTADARFTLSIPFDDDLVPAVPKQGLLGLTSVSGGHYQGSLNVGATW